MNSKKFNEFKVDDELLNKIENNFADRFVP
jgi:hypothetical protein